MASNGSTSTEGAGDALKLLVGAGLVLELVIELLPAGTQNQQKIKYGTIYMGIQLKTVRWDPNT